MKKLGGIVGDEVTGAKLGDLRLSRRFVTLTEMMAHEPANSFPQACGESSAALEGTYRFLNNADVTVDALLEPHRRATIERATTGEEVLVVHDTTDFTFNGEREGLGRLQQHQQGFLAHFALAVGAGTQHEALGVVGLLPVFRQKEKVTEHWRARYRSPDKESLRWGRLVETVAADLGQLAAKAIHVMDREADSYELFAQLLKFDRRFVIRARTDLRKTTDGKPISDAARDVGILATRVVAVTERQARNQGPRKKANKSRPLAYRPEREANLEIRACSVTIDTPDRSPISSPLRLNVVHVVEPRPPEGQDAVDWMLYTSEQIQSAEDVLKVVDHYRGRWVIEEYFKAIKTGCGYEKRQLTSRHALLNALAVFIPIAWSLLQLRQQSRPHPSGETVRPTALTPQRIQILRAVLKRPLPENPSGRDLLLAVAALGGHIKNNGDPGWLVLGRGFQKLLSYEVGWCLAECDQS